MSSNEQRTQIDLLKTQNDNLASQCTIILKELQDLKATFNANNHDHFTSSGTTQMPDDIPGVSGIKSNGMNAPTSSNNKDKTLLSCKQDISKPNSIHSKVSGSKYTLEITGVELNGSNNTSTVNQSSQRSTHPPDCSTLVKQPQEITDLHSGTQCRQEDDNSTIPSESEQSDEDVAYRTALLTPGPWAKSKQKLLRDKKRRQRERKRNEKVIDSSNSGNNSDRQSSKNRLHGAKYEIFSSLYLKTFI